MMRYCPHTSDDGARRCSGRVPTKEPGAVVRTLQLAGGQTNRAPALSGRITGSHPAPERGLPRRRVEAGSPDAAKSSLRYPARLVDRPSKRRAAVGDDRAGRSSCPSRLGQRPTGASLDALLLLPRRNLGGCALRGLPRWTCRGCTIGTGVECVRTQTASDKLVQSTGRIRRPANRSIVVLLPGSSTVLLRRMLSARQIRRGVAARLGAKSAGWTCVIVARNRGPHSADTAAHLPHG